MKRREAGEPDSSCSPRAIVVILSNDAKFDCIIEKILEGFSVSANSLLESSQEDFTRSQLKE